MSKSDAKGPAQFPGKIADNSTRDGGLSDLTQMARQAFEQKRRKQSLVLANAILKIDPDNAEARVIRTWVQQDLRKQIRNAQIQIEEARRENALSLWDRAERLVREVLSIDPDDEEAKALLAEVIPAQQALAEKREPENEPAHEEIPNEAERVGFGLGRVNRSTAIGIVLAAFAVLGIWIVATRDPASNEGANAAEPSATDGIVESEITTPPVGSLELIVYPTSGVELSVDDSPAQPVSDRIDLPPGDHRLTFSAAGYMPVTRLETVETGRTRLLPVLLKPIAAPLTQPATASRPAGSTSSSLERPPSRGTDAPPPPAPAKGKLAINAAVPVAVYFAGQQRGTTPTTIDLPPGEHSVEYRYEGLRKTVTHQIKSNETTSTTVVFEIKLQINSDPWSNVYVDGPSPRKLGETPLGNVTVGVGSVLVFRHSEFPEKRHTVTATDRAIQVSFP